MRTYSNVLIVSGEGAIDGAIEKHTGKPTLRAINRRLARERCNGDRWATAYIKADDTHANNTWIEIDADGNGVDMRTIDQDDIDS